ncbi:MAG: sel1 repeat family protein [Magnetococcales bacterium]|nr:sel1 repeat family protein [Magnetococcales bacterium]
MGSGWVKTGVLTLALLAAWPTVARADAEEDYQRGFEAYQDNDWINAIAILRNAASSGHLKSMVLLGAVLDRAEEDQEAVKWYRKAAEMDSPAGAMGLGQMYDKGEGVSRKDPDEAFKWFSKAAEQGHAPAKYALANAFRHGLMGQPVNPDRAAQWLKASAADKYTPAMIDLAEVYRKGLLGVKPDADAGEQLRKEVRALEAQSREESTVVEKAKPAPAKGK